MTTIWQISTDAIGRLDQASGIDLMERLLRSEARQNGIAASDVVITRRTNTPDRGIDAKHTSYAPTTPTTLIAGNTHHHIKSRQSFKPWQEPALRSDLFGRSKPHSHSLGDAVRLCL